MGRPARLWVLQVCSEPRPCLWTDSHFPLTHGAEPLAHFPRSLNTGELIKSSNEIRPFFDAALRTHPKQSHTCAERLAALTGCAGLICVVTRCEASLRLL